jgi:hypothetical protein
MPTLFPPIAGGTIAELAGKLELDPAALETTIAEFNAAVAALKLRPSLKFAKSPRALMYSG